MLKKYLERKLVLNSDGELMLENPIELDYYLVESSFENADCEYDKNRTYGFGISKRISGNCFEEEVIENYSVCINDAKTTLNILASNAVTPSSMMHILDDMLGSV